MMRTPLSWEDIYLYAMTKSTKDRYGLQRTREVESKYRGFLKVVPNVNKYIFEKYLIDKNYALVPNRFPYHTDKNVLHYILWFRPEFKIIPQEIQSTVHRLFPGKRYVAFINHPEVQSVPKVPHYHVFIKVD